MSSSAVTKQPQQSSQVHRHEPQDDGYEIESYEKETKASASAGLNLNIFAAFSGMFSSKTRKDTAADGSSVEHREEHGRVKGAGHGNMQAAGQGQLHDREAAYRHIPIGDDHQRIEDVPQKKAIEARK
ncbi:hypothetical protein CAC42_2171 [Sphaceloma murrayae]|uniref:Uncharacterized protein n=1 Tax=Sphaceloma murrayae TaxID=2082308 RepID=A0A2K1QJ68_9PEZI|nr:hypothetical protein CAC42_2171 [Sphaceloma murrayae]